MPVTPPLMAPDILDQVLPATAVQPDPFNNSSRATRLQAAAAATLAKDTLVTNNPNKALDRISDMRLAPPSLGP